MPRSAGRHEGGTDHEQEQADEVLADAEALATAFVDGDGPALRGGPGGRSHGRHGHHGSHGPDEDPSDGADGA